MSQALRSKKLQAGQGMTEYIIIVALIAVAAIGVYSFFGQAIRGQMAGMTAEITGTSSAAGVTVGKAAATGAQTAAAAKKDMGTYGGTGK